MSAGTQAGVPWDLYDVPSGALTQAAPVLCGGPGDQFGTDIEARGDDIYATAQQGVQGMVLHLAGTDTVPSWMTRLNSGSGLYGLSVSDSGIQTAGAARPPTYGARDGVGDTEWKPLLGQLALDGQVVKTSTENFFRYRGGENYGESLSVGTGSDEVIYATGYGEEYGWGGMRTILAQYGADGALKWKRAYATDASGNNLAGTMTRIGSAGYDLAWLNGYLYVAGYDRDANVIGGSGAHAMLLKYDAVAQPADPQPRADGAAALIPQWSRVLPVESDFRSITAADGYLYVAGHTFTSRVAGSEDFLLAKYDDTGRQVWQTTIGGSGSDVLTSIVAANGRLFASGYTTSVGAGGEDVIVLEIDSATGEVISQELFGGIQDDRAENAVAVGDSMWVIGASSSFAQGGNTIGQKDILLLRYDLMTDINEEPILEPIRDQTIIEGSTLSLVAVGTDPDQDPLVYTLDAAPADAAIGEQTGAFVFGAADGPETTQVVVRVTDNGSPPLSDTGTFRITVENVAPNVVVAGTTAARVGELVSFTFTASDRSPIDQAAGFTYDIDWNGDGAVDETLRGTSPLTVEHTFEEPGLTVATVTATDKDGGISQAMIHTVNVIQTIGIDVKPGSDTNPINLNANGVIPVAVFTTDDFNAAWLDVSSVRFAGAAAVQSAFEDLDGDGDMDLVLHFRLEDTNLLDAYADLLRRDLEDGKLDDNHQAIDAVLTGQASEDGESFFDFLGSDSVDLFLTGKKLKDRLKAL